MKSKMIAIHSSGNGFIDANKETEEMAVGMPEEQTLQMCLITEEMISLFRSVTGEVDNAEFWLEKENSKFTFHLTVRQKLGNVQRSQLIQSTSNKTNEAAKGFLGKLKEAFVSALSVGKDIDMYYNANDYSRSVDLTDDVISTPQWDKFERSVLLSLTDSVTISIRSGIVDLVAVKQF
ncbi:MAG: hypothetical protein K6A68_15090 [Clostridiales bacterium]|nr:hypothetical protein [Clostridia bacterium]MCR4884894.1 hypothetical protein [Clostridiales bacterium]